MAESFVAGGERKSPLGLCQACHSQRSWPQICKRRWGYGRGNLKPSGGLPSAASFAVASASLLPMMLVRLGVQPSWADASERSKVGRGFVDIVEGGLLRVARACDRTCSCLAVSA